MALPIGGFMPIPLAMMIPFMATQSMVMGDAFGRAFQYGKRKISAMSNEEFNATSLEQQASEMFASYKHIIPNLEASMDDSRQLQNHIIKEMLLIIPRFASFAGSEIVQSTQPAPSTSNNEFLQIIQAIYNVGNTPSAYAEDAPSTTDTTNNTPGFGITSLDELNKTGFEQLSNTELKTNMQQIKDGTWIFKNDQNKVNKLKEEFSRRHLTLFTGTNPAIPKLIKGTNVPQFRAYQVDKGKQIEQLLTLKSSIARNSGATKDNKIRLWNIRIKNLYSFYGKNRNSQNPEIKADAQREYTQRTYRSIY